jgi:hypothetical protein
MADAVTGLVKEVGTERERLETIINSIDDGIVVLDAERRVVAANDAFVSGGRGPGPARWSGSCCRSGDRHVHPGDCPTLACLGRRTPGADLRAAGDDGTVRGRRCTPLPSRTPTAVTHVVEVWRDISDRRAAEARIAESHRLGVARAARLGLLARAEHAARHGADVRGGILREVPTAGRGVDLGRGVAEQRGDCARPGAALSGHHAALPAPVARAGLVRRDLVDLPNRGHAAVARSMRRTARASVTIVNVEVGRRIRACVRADEAELQHALMNVLLNAVQACGEGGAVAVELALGRRSASASRTTAAASPGDRQRDLRAVLRPAPGRHGPRAVPVAQLRAPLGRRHLGHQRARPGLHLRDASCRRW